MAETDHQSGASAPQEDGLAPLRAAAARGEAAAQLDLGSRLLVGKDAPVDTEEGIALVRAAAEQGHAPAFNLMATLTAVGAWTQHSWPQALAFLVQAAGLGDEDARTQLMLIGERDLAAAVARGTVERPWRRLRDSADLERFVQPPAPVQVCDAPRIWTAKGFATPAECAWLMDRARDRLKPAKMYNRAEGAPRFDAIRNNSDYFFNVVESGVLLALLRLRISLLVSLPVPHMEPPQVLHYAPGQELRAHYDSLKIDNQGFGADGSYEGDRVVTFLLSLNDDYEGGDTHFVRADYRHRGKAGDAVFFANLKAGVPDKMSLHSGTSVTRGEKWLLSQWIHDRPFTATMD